MRWFIILPSGAFGTVVATLGVLLKYQDDLARITGQPAQRLVEAARGAE